MSEDDRPDPLLRRALDHAPDHGAVPDFRIGKRIRKMAREAVAPDAAQDLLPMLPDDRPWWRRLLFGSAGRGHMPWNAAFATVIVGVLVTVLWQREPVPGPQLDRQAPATERAPAAAPAAPAAPAPAPERRAETSTARPDEEPRIALPPTVPEAPALPGPPTPPLVPSLPFQLELPPAPRAPAAPPAAAKKGEQAERLADEAANRRASQARPSAVQPVPAAPAAAPQISEAAPAASAGAPGKSVADVLPQPTFVALSQWTRMTITAPGGESRSLSRAEAREIGALLGSAAITAVSPQPLRSKVDWRVTLERDGRPLAGFEMARGEVRWREDGLPAATGLPPEGALDGLRDALREAVAQQPQPLPPEVPR